jgi:hypothetical protein
VLETTRVWFTILHSFVLPIDSRKKKKIRIHRFVSSLKLDLASKLNKFQLCQAELENKTVAGFCHQFKRL